MSALRVESTVPRSSVHRLVARAGEPWAVVLGEEPRLLPQTLDRVALAFPMERTLVVTVARDAAGIQVALAGRRGRPHVLVQPLDRGTAASVLSSVYWIARRDREARVVVFPAGHVVAEAPTFMDYVREAVARLATDPMRLVLLGAPPTEPDPGYGWIELGARLGWAAREPVYEVHRLREAPAPELVEHLFASGCLWNTLVVAARAAALRRLGETCVPMLHQRLLRAAPYWGTLHEAWAIREAYALAPPASFAEVVEQASRVPEVPLATIKMKGVTWSDPGRPGAPEPVWARAGSAQMV